MDNKVVIDTNIYISAIFWGGKPRKIIDLARDGVIQIFISKEIVDEIEKILKKKFKLSSDETKIILLDLYTFTFPVNIKKRVQVILEDPDDDKFIYCAITSKAKFIISGDRHLLTLQEYSGIKILKASEFIQRMEEEVKVKRQFC